MDDDWPFETGTQCAGAGSISITGNWSIFYRCCQLNGELNDEWSLLNEDIWVCFLYLILFVKKLFLNKIFYLYVCVCGMRALNLLPFMSFHAFELLVEIPGYYPSPPESASFICTKRWSSISQASSIDGDTQKDESFIIKVRFKKLSPKKCGESGIQEKMLTFYL